MKFIDIKHCYKTYKNGVTAVADLTLSINKKEFVFITGASGCGKSTLIKMLYREEKPTKGEVYVGGINVSKLACYKPHPQLLPFEKGERRLAVPCR